MKRQTILFILAEIAKEMQIADIDRQLYLMERRSINLKRLNKMEEEEELLMQFYKWLCDQAIIDDMWRDTSDAEDSVKEYLTQKAEL